MKIYKFSTLGFFALIASANATVYINDFNAFDVNGAVSGQDGWLITEPSQASEVSFMTNYDPDGAGTAFSVSFAGSLGGPYEAPNVSPSTVGLSHSYGEAFGKTVSTFDFSITDNVGGSGSDPEAFAYSLYGSDNTQLFSVIFEPSITDPGQWDLNYSSGGSEFSLGMAVEAGNSYSFGLTFTPNGINTDFTFSIAAVDGTGPLSFGSTVAVNPSTDASKFAFEWMPTNPEGGENYLTFDNLSVVPEPSSALLAGLSGLAFVSTRRRRA